MQTQNQLSENWLRRNRKEKKKKKKKPCKILVIIVAEVLEDLRPWRKSMVCV